MSTSWVVSEVAWGRSRLVVVVMLAGALAAVVVTTTAGLTLLGGMSPLAASSTCSMGCLSLTLGPACACAEVEGVSPDFLKCKLLGRGFQVPGEGQTWGFCATWAEGGTHRRGAAVLEEGGACMDTETPGWFVSRSMSPSLGARGVKQLWDAGVDMVLWQEDERRLSMEVAGWRLLGGSGTSSPSFIPS